MKKGPFKQKEFSGFGAGVIGALHGRARVKSKKSNKVNRIKIYDAGLLPEVTVSGGDAPKLHAEFKSLKKKKFTPSAKSYKFK